MGQVREIILNTTLLRGKAVCPRGKIVTADRELAPWTASILSVEGGPKSLLYRHSLPRRHLFLGHLSVGTRLFPISLCPESHSSCLKLCPQMLAHCPPPDQELLKSRDCSGFFSATSWFREQLAMDRGLPKISGKFQLLRQIPPPLI